MEGNERRKQIIDILQKSENPLTGTFLAKKLKVSRQIIVQDIALLRVSNKNILSTNKGYFIFHPHENKTTRIFHVKHSDLQIRGELNAVVDYGGRLLDVIIEHEIYGQIAVDLQIFTRYDVEEFMGKLNMENVKPLSLLTEGEHYHTVEADTEEMLDKIEQEFIKKGILI